MNRKYGPDRYRESCRLLRKYFPGCAITTDLIVGFPGETEEDFRESLEFVRECAFAHVHIFPFSRREGTRAWSMPGQIPNAQKALRAARAGEICRALERADLESRVGSVRPVLFEQEEDGRSQGHIPESPLVKVPGTGLHNQILPVRITGVEGTVLTGEVIL